MNEPVGFGRGLSAENLTCDELCAAGASMGFTAAPGLRAGILSCRGRYLRNYVQLALRSLAAKDMLDGFPRGKPRAAGRAAEIAGMVCRPDIYITVRANLRETGREHTDIYIADGRAAAVTLDGGVYFFESCGELKKELSDIYGCRGYAAAKVSFEIELSELERAKQKADSFEAATGKTFRGEGLSDGDRDLLADAVCGKCGYLSFSSWTRSGNGYEAGLSGRMLVRGGDLLEMKYAGNGVVSVRGMPPEEVRARLTGCCSGRSVTV